MRRAGWITLVVSCSLTCLFFGVSIWSFVKPLPNNFDTLTFTIVSLGLMVGILAVISASLVAFQWSNFETRLKEIKEGAEEVAWRKAKASAIEISEKKMQDVVASYDSKIAALEKEVEKLNRVMDYRQ
jgi:hypothetical protein